MVYIERNQLPIVELQEKRNTLSYEELFQVLMERPAYAVYVELNGLLYGIITLGRIGRSHLKQLKYVDINTKFVSVGPNERMKVREIFQQERMEATRNKVIHVLPVVDCDGKLLGNYTQTKDLFSAEYSLSLLESLKMDSFIEYNLRLALVRPCKDDLKKQYLFHRMEKILKQKGVKVEVIDFLQALDSSNPADYIIFCAEEDHVTAHTLRECLSNIKKHSACFVHYEQFVVLCLEDVNGVLKCLQKRGVYVLTIDMEENSSGYMKKLNDKIEDRRRKNGRNTSTEIFPEMAKEFYLDLYEQFANQKIVPFSFYIQNEAVQLRDISSSLRNTEEGYRHTTGQPEKYEHCIYVVGHCTVLGTYVDDQHTISSLLQEKINRTGLKYKVENCGIVWDQYHGRRFLPFLSRLSVIPFREGDILIFYVEPSMPVEFKKLNLIDVLEQSKAPVTWFADALAHCNHKATQVFAEAIYESLAPVLHQPVEKCLPIERVVEPVRQLYLDQYFSDFDASAYNSVGSIVMNCNPFTFGHRYLIEEAIKQVDFLIIFAVEEDSSLFSFKERFAMICAGTNDLNHVKVVPSGYFILSKMTFPEYFIKETDEEIDENTENDIILFAEKVAPELGITHRFVGEEPEDAVTNEYNSAMKKILPAYGIQVKEIARKKDEENVISASSVRQYLEMNRWDKIKNLVPESTLQILGKSPV